MSVKLGFKSKEIIAEGRVRNDDIGQINSWVKEQEKIPNISEEEIVNFLLSNDNDQDGTKNTINAYFTVRNEAPDIFNNRIMSKENSESMQSLAHFGISPKRTEKNDAVIFIRLYDTNFRKFDVSKLAKYLFMTLDVAIYSSPPSGLIILIDLDGFGLMHLTKLKLGVVSIFFRYLQEALPVKLKNIHILNTPSFINKILLLVKPFMNDHVKELMIFHKRNFDMDEFCEKYVTKELLPEEYGGELPSLKDLTEQLIENFKDLESYFRAEENQRYIILKSSQK